MQPKKDNLLIKSLGFTPGISLFGHFSSHYFTTNFLILFVWRFAVPHIILWRPESMSKRFAISSSVLLHFSASFCVAFFVASLVLSSTVECLYLSSTSWTFLTKTPSHCLASNSWVPHFEKNFFRLTSISIFAWSKSTNTNAVYCYANTTQKQKPDGDITLKGLILSLNTLSSTSSAWISATFSAGVFVIWADAQTLHTSSCPLTLLGTFLTISAWFKWTPCLGRFLAI